MNALYEESFLYSSGTDLLIFWGAHLLERPEMAMEHEILADALAGWDKVALLDDLQKHLNRVMAAKEESVIFFTSMPLLPANPADERWNEAVEMLSVFDHLLYLLIAVEKVFSADASTDTDKIEKAYDDVCSWMMGDNNFTSLRLAPLNAHREDRLTDIPPDKQYLYPWYADFAGLAGETLQQIYENWIDIKHNGFSALTFIPESEQGLVWDCLKNDAGLQAALDHRIEVDGIIVQAIDNSMALRLFYLAITFSLNTGISDEIIEYGPARISCAILTNGKTMAAEPSDIEDYLDQQISLGGSAENILLTAFCSPFVSDGKRLEAFNWLETEADTLGGALGVMTKLELWRNRDISNRDLADNLIAAWESKAAAVIDSLRSDSKEFVTVASGAYHQNHFAVARESITSIPFHHVQGLYTLDSEVNIHESLRGKGYNILPLFALLGLKKYLEDKAYRVKARPDRSLGDETVEEEATIEESKNPLLFEDRNAIVVHTNIWNGELDVFADSEKHPDLKCIWEDIQNANRYFSIGWGVFDSEYEVVSDLSRFKKGAACKIMLKDRKYDAIVVAVSDLRDILRAVMEKEDIDATKAASVKWVVFLPEETP